MEFAGAASLAAAAAAGFAAAGSGLVAWTGPVDSPNARSSHDEPTVTTGGLAIVAAAAAGLAVFTLLAGDTADLVLGGLALAFAAALAAFGGFDDLYDYGAKPKLAIQAVAALAFTTTLAPIASLPLPGLVIALPALLGIAGAALWLVVVTNAVNFMDGADGLAAGCMAIALAALAVACFDTTPGLAATALVAAAALVGFLPWNLPSKRLFQGDVGSLFSGFLVAALGLVAYTRGAASLYLVPFALTPFLADVLLTLAMRARRGARLFEAHRDHLYQLWLRRTGRSHAALAGRGFALTAIYALAGLAAETTAPELQPLLWLLGFLVAAAGWKLMRRRLEA